MYKLSSVVAVAAVFSSAAHAVIVNVPGDQPTIRAAINAAMDGDEVVVAQGEYFENINFNGKAITVRSTNPTDAGVVMHTIINGGGSGSVVTCDSGEGPGTVLKGLTMAGGTGTSVENPPGSGVFELWGGGMYNDSSSPTVTSCSFIGNSATNGGGMVNNNNSNPTVANCVFG